MKKKLDSGLIWLLAVTLVLSIFWLNVANAKEARTVRLDDKKVAQIFVRAGRSTVLNFPVKPTKVILGNSGAFAIQYIENDLALSPLTAGASSNLFVYLQGRRFGFDLIPSSSADEIVIVRDILDKQVTVRIQNE